RRVKVAPPSVETDAPEKLLFAALRESLKATTIWSGVSGLAVGNVSDWIMCGGVSVPVIKSTSLPPYARGAITFWTIREEAPLEEPEPPPCASPQAIMMRPARRLSILLKPFS